jgi:hypothetical protein
MVRSSSAVRRVILVALDRLHRTWGAIEPGRIGPVLRGSIYRLTNSKIICDYGNNLIRWFENKLSPRCSFVRYANRNSRIPGEKKEWGADNFLQKQLRPSRGIAGKDVWIQ